MIICGSSNEKIKTEQLNQQSYKMNYDEWFAIKSNYVIFTR